MNCRACNFETDLEGLLDENYWKERNEITNELEGIDNKANRKDYLETLMRWKRLLIARLAKRTDYLPSQKVSLWIGNGRLIEADDPVDAKELIRRDFEKDTEQSNQEE